MFNNTRYFTTEIVFCYQFARRNFTGSNTRMLLGVNSIRPSCLNSLRVRMRDSGAVPTMAAMSSRESWMLVSGRSIL